MKGKKVYILLDTGFNDLEVVDVYEKEKDAKEEALLDADLVVISKTVR